MKNGLSPLLLSIVVPTKNRYYYLTFLTQYFHSIKSDSIELIIQDNSDDLTFKQEFINYIESLNDKRILYSFSAESLSVVDNCDLAIRKASGEYLCMLGDDDIFSKYMIDFLKEHDGKIYDAILPSKGSFTWPDVKSKTYKTKSSGIYQSKDFNNKIVTRDVNLILSRVLHFGGTKMLNLPRVYHGIIRKSVLDSIYKESGTYFPGPSPDMGNAIALCKYVTNYIEVDLPLVISGHSISSAGGQGQQGQHYGDINKIAHLPKNTAENWTNIIPFYWSGYTIYGESVLQALKRMNMNDKLVKFNLNFLYATCLVFDSNYKDRITSVLKQDSFISLFVRMFCIYTYTIPIWIERIIYHLRNNLILLMPDFIKNRNKMIFKMNNTIEVAIINDENIKSKNPNYL